ncbi:MAG: hypothetical protein M1825_004090 [Sarcosagium campestre]|nr:MAG: hypothetical protein M1825_004090 [Sarcosagium campestre]
MGLRQYPDLSEVLPPLVLGTAGLSYQLDSDPLSIPSTKLVHKAFEEGIRAFDSSPYYGPAEELLGQALNTECVKAHLPRETYFILTKVGRISASEFNYSPAWIRQSVQRSLARLHTEYLDVAYCHDVEFVSPAEVLAAVKELRRIRDETGAVRYVGISGYPVDVLCDIAEMILRETGQPLDIVMSYANFNLQNTRLSSEAIPRLLAAGVKVVPNASPLGMGLLRHQGVPIGALGDFHPAVEPLRMACHNASRYCAEHGQQLEIVALRYAIEKWTTAGASVGSSGKLPVVNPDESASGKVAKRKLGVTVLGSSYVEQLEETMKEYRSVLQALGLDANGGAQDSEQNLQRDKEILDLAEGARNILGEWIDATWESPPAGFKNTFVPSDVPPPNGEENKP